MLYVSLIIVFIVMLYVSLIISSMLYVSRSCYSYAIDYHRKQRTYVCLQYPVCPILIIGCVEWAHGDNSDICTIKSIRVLSAMQPFYALFYSLNSFIFGGCFALRGLYKWDLGALFSHRNM